MSLFDNKCYKIGSPDKLVIFIHGYNGTPEAIDYAVQSLLGKLQNCVVVVPRAPFVCEKDPTQLQWLSFYAEDPDVRFRHPEASTDEIFDIFNRLGSSFAQVAAQMNEFIDEQQKKWQIADDATYLMGFSQGAMISIYTALTRCQPLAGCIPIAGIIPGWERLGKEIVSRPPFLVLHGKDDATVQYKTLPRSLAWLKEHGIVFEVAEFDELAHRMNDAEMEKAAAFIDS